MKKIFLLLLIQASLSVARACYNEVHVVKNGETSQRSYPMSVFYNEPDTETATTFLNHYQLDKLEQYTKDEQSDIAVNMAYLGRYPEALAILERLVKKYPEDYNIAANLGTTYELTGKNELALRFIKKGMELNPDSHGGSEWVHVKILEAKLQLAKDPGWLAKHRVLNTGVNFNSPQSKSFFDQAEDVEYQLQERVPFTPFPDKLLANVFDELGDLYATQQSIELAYIAYDFSLHNDPADPYGVQSKMDQLKPLLRKNNIPVPSWKQHYYNRKLSKLQSDITEKILNAVLSNGKDNQDRVKDEEAGRERQRRNQLFLFGGIGLAVVMMGFVVYSTRKKKS